MEEKQFEIVFKNEGGVAEIDAFEALRKFALEKCDEYRKQVPSKIETKAELKAAKDARAALNNTAKMINARKIIEIKELTGKLQSQAKEICDLFESTADLFKAPIDAFEGKEKKPVSTLTVKADPATIDKVEAYLKRNKIEYTRKDN